MRQNLFQFCSEEEQKIRPDFWGSTSSDEDLRTVMKDPNNGTIIKNDEFRLKDRKSGKHLY
jgi:hypothetical protein